MKTRPLRFGASLLTTASLCVLLALPVAVSAQAQPPGPPPPVPVNAAQRLAVVQALGERLQSYYVFPDVAQRLAGQLLAKAQGGGYATAGDSKAFADALTRDLRELGQDAHFRVRHDPRAHAASAPPASEPVLSPAQVAEEREHAARVGYGITSVQRLPGNVGYLALDGFGPPDFVAQAYSAAMTLLAGSEALILDLRQNHGGEPASVAYLVSHFFQLGDERHLNDIEERAGAQTRLRTYWTLPVPGPRHLGPLYVLTSRGTFSGGEECAYDLQTQKRATLIGETTGGGANPGEVLALAEGFAAFIPNGRAINPVTHTNWEHVGVKPDLAVPASEAMKTAYTAALKAAQQRTGLDPRERDEVADALAGVGKMPLPGDSPAGGLAKP